MLLSAVNVAGSFCEDSVYDPWAVIRPEGYTAVVSDLCKAYDVVVVRRKEARDTSERWFGVASVSLLLLESPWVSKLCAFQMLLKSVRWNICPSLFLPHTCPVQVSLSKALGRGNRKKVRRPPNLQSSVVLNSTMSQKCCPRDGEFISMTPVLQLLCVMTIKLFPRAVVVVVVVQRLSFSQVPDNFTYLCI